MRNNPYHKNLKEHLPLVMLGSSSTTALISNEGQKSIIEEAMKLPDPKQYQVRGVSFNMISSPLLNLNATPNLGSVLNIEMGQTEVTQELFQAVMGWNDSGYKKSLQGPVENVSWYDCLSFCNKLSALLGFEECYSMTGIKMDTVHIAKAKVRWDESKNGFRLPTEKEWKLFAKAGTNNQWSGTDYEYDLGQYDWYSRNSENKTHPVAQLRPNEWGLYDMSGNVQEWCWDSHKSPRGDKMLHLMSGGSIWGGAKNCQISSTGLSEPSQRISIRGFRLCRSFN